MVDNIENIDNVNLRIKEFTDIQLAQHEIKAKRSFFSKEKINELISAIQVAKAKKQVKTPREYDLIKRLDYKFSTFTYL
jgi:argonaute-like protein implicated in RNA metabolism and viral defense